MESFHDLPPDLPVPEDDGAAGHLRGTELRPITLSATSTASCKRLTLIAREGVIDAVIYPVLPPGSDAARAVSLLR